MGCWFSGIEKKGCLRSELLSEGGRLIDAYEEYCDVICAAIIECFIDEVITGFLKIGGRHDNVGDFLVVDN